MFAAYKWENDAGLNVSKEHWASTTAYCQQKEFELIDLDDVDGEDATGSNDDDCREVLMMLGQLESGENFVTMVRGSETC